MAVTTDHGRSKGRRTKTTGLRHPEVEGTATAVETLVADRTVRMETDAGAPPERDELRALPALPPEVKATRATLGQLA